MTQDSRGEAQTTLTYTGGPKDGQTETMDGFPKGDQIRLSDGSMYMILRVGDFSFNAYWLPADGKKSEVGRPSKYRPEYCERVIELGRDGLSVVEMAAELGVHRETLEENWPRDFPEFSEAFTQAMQLSQAWWEGQGRKYLLLPPGAGTFNSSVWSRSMAARFPRDWRESKGVELTGANGGPVQVENIAIEFVSPKREA